MIFHNIHFCFRNCIIKKGNVTIPYMAIATRTRSKISQNSTNDKEFQDFLNTMVSSARQDVTSSESFTMSSSSSSSYYWSEESPDSVVPGSTTSSDATSSTVVTSNHIASDNYSDLPDSIQGSSVGNFEPVPGFTQSVNNDLKVSLNLLFHSIQR